MWVGIISRWVAVPTVRKVFTLTAVLTPRPDVLILQGSHTNIGINCLPSVDGIHHTQQQHGNIIDDKVTRNPISLSFWTMDGPQCEVQMSLVWNIAIPCRFQRDTNKLII